MTQVEFMQNPHVVAGASMSNEWKIGDVIPLSPQQPIQFSDQNPAWYALLAMPQREGRVQTWLERKGVYSWFPTEKAWRKIARGRRRKAEYQRRIVPGYVFARFDSTPRWDVVFSRDDIRSVVGHHEMPLSITDDQMADMVADLPERLKEIEEARAIRAGDKVEIVSGLGEGWRVQVERVEGEMVDLFSSILGGSVMRTSIQHIRKLDVS